MTKRQPEAEGPHAFLPLKPKVFHILLALSEQHLHGYGIMKAVEEASEGQIRIDPSPLYRQLKRLLEKGIVEEAGSRPVSGADDQRRRYYGLTGLGREVLAAEATRVVALSNTIAVQTLASQVK